MIRTLTILLSAILAASASAQTVQITVETLGQSLRGVTVRGLAAQGSRIYAATDSAGLFVLDASQPNPDWRYLGLENQRCSRVAVSPHNDRLILAMLRSNGGVPDDVLMRSWDGGSEWHYSDSGIDTTVPLAPIGIWFSPHDPALVVALFGAYYGDVDVPPYVSRDTGITWTPLGETEGIRVHDLIFDAVDPMTVYAVGRHSLYGAALMVTNDGGTTWRLIQMDVPEDVRVMSVAASPTAPSNIIVTADFGMFISTDRGETWSPRPMGSGPVLLSESAWDLQDSTLGFVAGASTDRSAVALSTDMGTTWEKVRIDSLGWVTGATTSSAMPGAYIVATGASEWLPAAVPGVFVVRATEISGAEREQPLVRASAWFDGRSFRLAGERRQPFRIFDATGRVVSCRVEGDGRLSLEELPHGSYWLVTEDGMVVRGVK